VKRSEGQQDAASASADVGGRGYAVDVDGGGTGGGPQHDSEGGDAPLKQVAQAMERLDRTGRLTADIRLGADRLLEALFVGCGAPPYSAHQHAERTARVFVQEDAAMHRHFQDLRAPGRYPALPTPFSLSLGRKLGGLGLDAAFSSEREVMFCIWTTLFFFCCCETQISTCDLV
jgi:hypothetical protein